MPLLEVINLDVTLNTPHGSVRALRGVSFKIERGAVLGLIGESGSGKSMTALALMGLLPGYARINADASIQFDGAELLDLRESAWQRLRGNRIAMVFQDPMAALNPVQTVGDQVAEPLRIHKGMGRGAARRQAAALLERVGIPSAQRRMDDYPHQFSGGQRQRITIAMALACGPDLLIADEPTTALDVTVQQQILDLLADLVAERNMALLLVSHDLGVIAQNADDMLVMYGGQIMESGPTADIFAHMAHPYTRALLAARPRLNAPRQSNGRPYALYTIAGKVPALVDMPPGCPFSTRCPFAQAECRIDSPPRVAIPNLMPGEARWSSLGAHQVRCLRPEAIRSGSTQEWQ